MSEKIALRDLEKRCRTFNAITAQFGGAAVSDAILTRECGRLVDWALRAAEIFREDVANGYHDERLQLLAEIDTEG